MTNREILIKLSDPELKGIYGYMYGQPWKHTHTAAGQYYERDKIIFIKKSDLRWWNGEGGAGVYFIWGWPGPDYNVYLVKDYGYSWAFSEEEIITTNEPPRL